MIRNDHIINGLDTTNGPLWRFILGEVDRKEKRNTSLCDHEYALLLKLHHSICDGISASDLMCRQFLPILTTLANRGEPKNMSPILPQVKSQEEFFSDKGKDAKSDPMVLKY